MKARNLLVILLASVTFVIAAPNLRADFMVTIGDQTLKPANPNDDFIGIAGTYNSKVGGGQFKITDLDATHKARVGFIDTNTLDELYLTDAVFKTDGTFNSGTVVFQRTFKGGPNGNQVPAFVHLDGFFGGDHVGDSTKFKGVIDLQQVGRVLSDVRNNQQDHSQFMDSDQSTVSVFGDRELKGTLDFSLHAGDSMILPGSAWVADTSDPSSITPEPSSCLLTGIGAASLFAYGWKRRKRTAA